MFLILSESNFAWICFLPFRLCPVRNMSIEWGKASLKIDCYKNVTEKNIFSREIGK